MTNIQKSFKIIHGKNRLMVITIVIRDMIRIKDNDINSFCLQLLDNTNKEKSLSPSVIISRENMLPMAREKVTQLFIPRALYFVIKNVTENEFSLFLQKSNQKIKTEI